MKKLLLAALSMGLVLSIAACQVLNAGKEQTPPAEDTIIETPVPVVKERPVLGISLANSGNAWDAAVIWSAKESADKLSLSYKLCEAATAAEQASHIDELISSGCKLIILYGFEDDLPAMVSSITNAGVALILYDKIIETETPVYTVGQNNKSAGIEAGEYMLKKLNGSGKALVISSEYDAAHIERSNGFIETVKGSAIEVLGGGPISNSDDAINAALLEHGQIDGVYCTDDDTALKVLSILGGLNREDIKVIISSGGSKKFINEFDKHVDMWLGTLSFSPYTMSLCVNIANGLIAGETYEANTVIPVESIDRENYAAYLSEYSITDGAPY